MFATALRRRGHLGCEEIRLAWHFGEARVSRDPQHQAFLSQRSCSFSAARAAARPLVRPVKAMPQYSGTGHSAKLYKDKVLARHLAEFETLLVKSGEDYFVDKKFSFADLGVFNVRGFLARFPAILAVLSYGCAPVSTRRAYFSHEHA